MLFQTAAIVVTLGIGIRSLVINRRVLKHDAYERLTSEYQATLQNGFIYRHLDQVWEPLPDSTIQKIRENIQADNLWPVWSSLNQDQKDCYRYTRTVLEIFERAWQLNNADYIDQGTWNKWKSWISTWSKSSYFWFVYHESSFQLIDDFSYWLKNDAPDLDEPPRWFEVKNVRNSN